MSTTKQDAASRNVKKAVKAQSASTKRSATTSSKISTAKKDDLPDSSFAFPKERKEPLIDAKHVRNALARFDQVEGVSDAERDRAWRRIKTAAKKFDVAISESSWRELGHTRAKKH
jgi:hypothetical protein